VLPIRIELDWVLGLFQAELGLGAGLMKINLNTTYAFCEIERMSDVLRRLTPAMLYVLQIQSKASSPDSTTMAWIATQSVYWPIGLRT
jgi:hypothetical protein